jgi:hypothetical protein
MLPKKKKINDLSYNFVISNDIAKREALIIIELSTTIVEMVWEYYDKFSYSSNSQS